MIHRLAIISSVMIYPAYWLLSCERDYTLCPVHHRFTPKNAGKASSGADIANNRRTTKLISSGVIALIPLSSSTLLWAHWNSRQRLSIQLSSWKLVRLTCAQHTPTTSQACRFGPQKRRNHGWQAMLARSSCTCGDATEWLIAGWPHVVWLGLW